VNKARNIAKFNWNDGVFVLPPTAQVEYQLSKITTFIVETVPLKKHHQDLLVFYSSYTLYLKFL